MKFLFGIFLAVCCLLSPGLMANAQMQPGNQAISLHDLSQIEQQLKFLKEVNRLFPDPALNKIILESEKHLKQATQAYKARKMVLAAGEMRMAQRLIDQGLKLVVQGPSTQLLEDVNEKIRIVQNALKHRTNPQAYKLLQNAITNRDRSLNLRHKNVPKMMELLRLANSQLDNALKLLGPDAVDMNLSSLVREEKAAFRDLELRARNLLQTNPSNLAQQLYHQAIAQAKKADEFYSKGQMERCIETYRWAARLLWRVVDLAGASEVNWQRQAREELRLTRELLRSAGDAAETGKNKLLNRVLRQATKIYLDAEHSFEQKRYPEAVRKAEYARRLINRVRTIDSDQKATHQDNLGEELSMLTDLLRDIDQQMSHSGSKPARRIFQTASRYAQMSQQAIDQRDLFRARSYLYLATRLCRELQNWLANPGQMTPSELQARQISEEFFLQYQQLRTDLRASQQPEVKIWLNLAQELASAIQQAEREQDYSLQTLNARIGLQVLSRLKNQNKDPN